MKEPTTLKEIRKALRSIFKAVRYCENPRLKKRLERVYTKLQKIGSDMLSDDKSLTA